MYHLFGVLTFELPSNSPVGVLLLGKCYLFLVFELKHVKNIENATEWRLFLHFLSFVYVLCFSALFI